MPNVTANPPLATIYTFAVRTERALKLLSRVSTVIPTWLPFTMTYRFSKSSSEFEYAPPMNLYRYLLAGVIVQCAKYAFKNRKCNISFIPPSSIQRIRKLSFGRRVAVVLHR